MQGYLHLQNGQSFEGEVSSTWGEDVQGEIVFFTGMTGYQEVLTDPSYKDQIVVFTYPLIGNYGINDIYSESKGIQVSGVVMFHCANQTSHHEASISLSDYLDANQVPFITKVDTREVTKAIRKDGTRQAVVSNKTEVHFLKPKTGQIYQTENKDIEEFGEGDVHIGLIDFGWKKSIMSSFLNRGIKVTTVPFSKAHQLQGLSIDGLVLSNGPGDPKDAQEHLSDIKNLLEALPSFGICMGHQIIALAYGADTQKLSFGHRGANHPVKDDVTGKVFMSSQNHNYVVDEESLLSTPLSKRFLNVNDGSIEGLEHSQKPILSVQFHPEAHPGPADAEWLFEHFISLITNKKGEEVHV
ncbi:carbamoyl phosphate synthase small subunit [Halobacillus sp. B29]|uniref:carbamoyl phosphate synthase small subunit n=1 Tax=Halobacillus sp. B29 TaxID=3457432 RepID=UPI003FCDAFD9